MLRCDRRGSDRRFNYFTVARQGPPCVAGDCTQARVKLPVYNLVPFHGVPSMVGFLTKTGPTFIVGARPGRPARDLHDQRHPGTPRRRPAVIGSRLVFNGRAGNGTYLTMPSNCAGGQTTVLYVDSQDAPSKTRHQRHSPPRSAPIGCERFRSNRRSTSTSTRSRRLAGSGDRQRGIPFDPEPTRSPTRI